MDLQTPKKIFAGKKRIALRGMSLQRRKLMEWAIKIKVGDYVATCEGCNRKVAKIQYIWRPVLSTSPLEYKRWKNRKQTTQWAHAYLDEVEFTDTNGQLHYCPGGGCAYPKETNQQITSYFKEAWQVDVELDENGELLKEPDIDVWNPPKDT